jgi:acyl carrier protein
MTPEDVADVFCAVLDIEDVRPDDSFFDIGGNSFTALTLVARLNAASGKMFRLRDVIREPTPLGLAHMLGALSPVVTDDAGPA